MNGDDRVVARADHRWPAAVEQAGAAVIALARGRRLEFIVLGRPELSPSVDPMRRRMGFGELPPRPPPRTRRTVEDEIMSMLGGPLARRRLGGPERSVTVPPATFERAVELAREESGSVEEAEAYVARLEELTDAMLADERRWNCVETLAALLISRGVIDGREARGLFQRVVLSSTPDFPRRLL